MYIFVKIFQSTAPTSRKQRAWMVFETLEYGDYVTSVAVAILDPEPKQNLNSNFNNKNNQIFINQRFLYFCNNFDDCFLKKQILGSDKMTRIHPYPDLDPNLRYSKENPRIKKTYDTS